MYRCIVPIILIGFFICTILFLGCVSNKQDELSVFAAVSLKDALTEIGAGFTDKHKVKIYYSFGASTTLQRQIEKGASVDIYISASSHQIYELQQEGLIETTTRQDLLTNKLVVVSHKDSILLINNLNDLTDRKITKIAIGQPGIVPAGTYTKEAFTQQNLWDKIHSKLIFGNNVRSTLAFVASRNVDLGIVYQTDVVISNNIKVILDIPPETHSKIRYPAAVIRNTTHKQLAEVFISYLRSKDASDIFDRYGFTTLTSK
ncbi:molybdate ABC transporter substrate-binding protein [Candidatus Poribacteria bacterium]|nr:MAG: molybdate ABC transporter substrate-binding protein [Candidatus Poribacteria bacterium]